MRGAARAAVVATGLTAVFGVAVGALPSHESGTTKHVAARAHATPAALPTPRPTAFVTPPAHLVVLGDSVATGAGCDCRPFAWALAHEAATLTHRVTELALLAHDGLTTAGLLDQVRHEPTTIASLRVATTVTVTIGANDFDSSQAGSACSGTGTDCFSGDLGTLPAELAAVIYQIRSLAGPQVQVLVTGYWNVFLDGSVAAQQGRTYQATSDALTRRVNSALAATARAHGGTYVDLYRPFRGDGDTDDTALLASDGDHPSAAGHRLIAGLLAHAIAAR